MTERYSGFGSSGHSGNTEQQIQSLIAEIHQSINQSINSQNEPEQIQIVNQEESIQIPESLAKELQGLPEKISNLLENMINILTDFNFGFEAKLVAIGPMLSELVATLNGLFSVLRTLGLEYIEENSVSVKFEEMLLLGKPAQWHPLIQHLFQKLANADNEGNTKTPLGVISEMELLKVNLYKKIGSDSTRIIDPNRLTGYKNMIAAITRLIHMGPGSPIPEFEAQLERAKSIEDILTLITQIEELIIFLSAIKEYSTNEASTNLINYIIENYSRILQRAKEKLENTKQGQLAETNSWESFTSLVKELENRFEALASSLREYSRQAQHGEIPYSFFWEILDKILQTYEEPLIELMRQIQDEYMKITAAYIVNQGFIHSYFKALRICDEITFLLYGEEGMLTLIRNRISEAYSLLKKHPNNANLSLEKTKNLIQEIEKRLPRLTAQSEDKELISQIGRLRQEYTNMLDNLRVAESSLNKLESAEPT